MTRLLFWSPFIAVALAAVACGGDRSGNTPAQSPPQQAAVPIMSACALLTTAEANEVLKLPQIAALRSRDSVREAARGQSTCVYGPPPHTSIGEVVTVFVENGLRAVDQQALNRVATDMGTGETAQTATGFGVPAATMASPPTIVAQKGSYRVLISAPTADGTRDLAQKAIGRLP